MARRLVLAVLLTLTVIGLPVPARPESQADFVPIQVAATQHDESVVVRRGDSLWRIAERRVAEINGGDPAIVEVGTYWRRLIAENGSRLRSGDPDLIYPGEVVILPGSG